ncbi:UNVERIFIED_CONTAM: hypothetical protein FKN15_078425 [Acipenser sinensis]
MHGLIFETSICYWQDQPGSRAFRIPRSRAEDGGTSAIRPPGSHPPHQKRLREADGGSAGGRNATEPTREREGARARRALERNRQKLCGTGTADTPEECISAPRKRRTQRGTRPAGPPQAQARPLDGRAPGLLDHAQKGRRPPSPRLSFAGKEGKPSQRRPTVGFGRNRRA